MRRDSGQNEKVGNFLESLGFSQEASRKVSGLLPTLPDWEKQFETGKMPGMLPKEGKTTKAQGLPDMDVNNRPGKQKGEEGKQDKHSSLSIQSNTLIPGNPQPGPRSRSDRKGLSMFSERVKDT